MVTRQAHATHHVHLEKPPPVVVVDLEERLDLEDTGVVDQNVDSETAVINASMPSGPPRSAATPSTVAPGTISRMRATDG
jgi:hypothetical protein